jgi:hypothetical protein
MRAEQAQQIAQLSAQAEGAIYFDAVRVNSGLKQVNQVK